MKKTNEFNYKWYLQKTKFTKDKGKVFSCFACGGGSTMGYKLAGFDVIGCNEIDPKMVEIYETNHNPKFVFLQSITELIKREDLPQEMFELDILDGSPPCSSFSLAGLREKNWGKKKKFREGQKEQILDRLFFDFISLSKKLQPKIVIAENVKGILLGNAKKYVCEIYRQFDEAGFYVQHFVLNAKNMSIPQNRERVFFIALRKDLSKHFENKKDFFNLSPYLNLEFNDKTTNYIEIEQPFDETITKYISNNSLKHWKKLKPGQAFSKVHPKGAMFNQKKINPNKPLPTITASNDKLYHYAIPRKLYATEYQLASSFPLDYNFLNNQAVYVCGMSVPPVMMANISKKIYEQWLTKISNETNNYIRTKSQSN